MKQLLELFLVKSHFSYTRMFLELISQKLPTECGEFHTWPGDASESETGKYGFGGEYGFKHRVQFRRARFQTPNSVSFLALTEFRERELSEFLSAYYLCAKANSPSFFAELTEFAPKLSEAQRP